VEAQVGSSRMDGTISKKTLVIGLGRSGLEVCRASTSAKVVATDIKPASAFDCNVLEELQQRGVRLVLGSHDVGNVDDFDEIVVSPGVPMDNPLVREATARGIEVISELEWAWRRVSIPIIAITGTNGKTTTTELTGKLFQEAGYRVFVGGNIGTPLSSIVKRGEEFDLAVLEVSSFQLDTSPTFAADTAVVLNISEDHLDRYENFEEYARSKISLIGKARRKKPNVPVVINGDDPVIWRYIKIDDHAWRWTCQPHKNAQARVGDCEIVVNIGDGKQWHFKFGAPWIFGRHNLENIAAAALVAAIWKLPEDVLQRVFWNFRPGKHRIEWIGRWNGVNFYNDSKATNVSAVLRAIECFQCGKIWLLLGGKDKGGDYGPLARAVLKKCAGAVCFGEAGARIYEVIRQEMDKHMVFIRDRCPYVIKKTKMEDAFFEAVSHATPGDVVLLSPACSSFDQYTSYVERGEHFRQLVDELIRSKK